MKIYLTLAIILFSLLGIEVGLRNFHQTHFKVIELSKQASIQEAKALFENIVTFRSWNAEHGGVFVKQHDNLQPNPYLQDNFIYSKDNEVLIKINPAWMTRQVAEMIDKSRGYAIRITSLKPINPRNTPDDFERTALMYLEHHKDEPYYYRFNESTEQLNFMGALTVTAECLQCHASQNYKLGDIRGGIRVSIPTPTLSQSIQNLDTQARQLRQTVLVLYIIVVGLCLGLLKLIMSRQQKIARLNTNLQHKVAERTEHLQQANASLQKAFVLEKARAKIFGFLLRQDYSLQELIQFITHYAQQLTQSSYAAIGLYNTDATQVDFYLLTPDQQLLPLSIPSDTEERFWQTIITTTDTFTNDLTEQHITLSHPLQTLSVTRYACTAVHFNQQLIGQICVCEKASAYQPHDLNVLHQLAEFCALGVNHLRIAADLKQARAQEKSIYREVKRLSITDPLTNLFNRRHFDKQFTRKLNLAKRLNLYLGLFILDLDHFKRYNDSYGHQAGDNALITVAGIIKAHMRRSNEQAFRVGGEEFCCLVLTTEEKPILELAEAIRAAIVAAHIEHNDNDRYQVMTASIGVKVASQFDAETFDSIYKAADEALYKAKQMGRNCVALAS